MAIPIQIIQNWAVLVIDIESHGHHLKGVHIFAEKVAVEVFEEKFFGVQLKAAIDVVVDCSCADRFDLSKLASIVG